MEPMNGVKPDEIKEKDPKKELDIGRECYEWSQALLQAVIAVLILFAFVASVYSVKGDSMLDTLEDKQMLLISRLFYTPQHGDIVMFTKYGLEAALTEEGLYAPFVKRVIGIPGDQITFDIENACIYRNGDVLEEPYIRETMRYNNISEPSFVVPEGMVFVMGDNRNNSHDSRVKDVGFVDQRFILGRVLWRVTPITKFGSVK